MGDWHLVKVTKCEEVNPKPGGRPFSPFLSLNLLPYGEAMCSSSRYAHLWADLKKALDEKRELNVEIEVNEYQGKKYHNVVDIEGIPGADGHEGTWSADSNPTKPNPPAPRPVPPGVQENAAKELAKDVRALICVAAGLLCNSSPGSEWIPTLKLVETYVLRGELP